MRSVLVFLFLCTLQAANESFTYKVTLPENLRNIFELPGRLISNSADTFPDFTKLYAEPYRSKYHEFQSLGIPSLQLREAISKLHGEIDRKTFHENIGFFVFLNFITSRITEIYSTEMPAICDNQPEILTMTKQEQTSAVYTWYNAQHTSFLNQEIGDFVKEHVHFSSDADNKFGTLIINGEKICLGTCAEL